MRTLRRLAAAAVAAVLVSAAGLAGAAPAWAAAAVTVTGPDGTATVSSDYATEVTVTGSGFQAIQNGFGGVYVLFGWVDDARAGTWKPSAGGTVGTNYRYVPDAESADNAGFQKFLAFSGSQTESSAHGVINADGSWSIGMVIPGARFESQDRDGDITAVDCLRTTCGIITIGAHGVKNANNETFTPLTFAAGAIGAAPAADAPAAEEPAVAAAGAVRVGVESASVAAGTSIVFTGQGFTPGEQVVASLDGGLTAVGPLTAGTQGEVAAALPVPREIRNGTHLVTLTGAGSGAVAEAEVTVTGGTLAVEATTAETPPWALVVLLVSIVLSVALVITSIITAVVRARARRRARRAAGPPTAVPTTAAPATAGPVGAAPPVAPPVEATPATVAEPATEVVATARAAEPATEVVAAAPPTGGPDDLTTALPAVASSTSGGAR